MRRAYSGLVFVTLTVDVFGRLFYFVIVFIVFIVVSNRGDIAIWDTRFGCV